MATSLALGCAPLELSTHNTPSRAVCGWKDYRSSLPTLAIEAGGTKRDERGEIVALVVDDDVSFGAVAAAVGQRPELVRLEVVVGERSLLPLTYVGEPLRRPAPRPDEEVAIVGHRRVIRTRGAPRVRVADLRLHRDARVEVFVEHGPPGGREVDLAGLAQALRETAPPVETMTVHADDEVPWRDFVMLVRASACFDRGPGDEPHELIWDERQPPE